MQQGNSTEYGSRHPVAPVHPRADGRPRSRTTPSAYGLVLGLLLACPGLFVPAEADEPPSNDGTLYLELHNGGILRDAVRVHPRRMEEFTIDFSPRELANSELPASIRVEDVYRGLLVDALRHPAPGPALVSGWQQQVVDLATGQPVNEETFALWLERRGRMGAGTTSYSGVPRHSARKIDDAMRLQGRDCYTEVERQVVEELAARDVETLVPIAALYGAVYGYQTIPSPLFWLRETNRELLLDLVELHYEETGNRPLYIAQLLALVDMQRSMVLYQDGDKALGLLDYILDLEPDHAIARYWAGYLSEKFGEYRKAVHHYERYLEEDDDLEVRLRLGVNRLRAGEEDAGRAGLEVIARDQQAPRWMRLLAWSELASAFGDSNPRRAEALLVEAIEAFPADPGLRLQLAYHHRISAWDASVAELERALELGPAQEGAGPRVLYERPREEGLAANRAWLARQVAERASRLFETLDVLEGTWRRQLRKERNVVQHCQELLERGR